MFGHAVGKDSRDMIEVRAPALPAQPSLGGGLGRGAKPPSEPSQAAVDIGRKIVSLALDRF